MSHRYVIIGAGRQGTAAAFDLARFGEAGRVVLADARRDVAQRAATRVNTLLQREVAEAAQVDAANLDAVRSVVAGASVVLSAVTYYFNVALSEACIASGASFCDMGGNTDVVWAQLRLDDAARRAGVSIVPDCGMGPGLINNMGVYVMDLLDRPREVFLYDGCVPQHPQAPWNYLLTFHVNGLTNEYDGHATFIRDGKLVEVPTLTECAPADFGSLGMFESFVISGSMSTTPQTHLGKLQRYETKVLRYPGHYATFEAYKRLGLFSEEPITVNGQEVVPRAIYHALLDPRIRAAHIEDLCIMRAVGVGEKDGREARVTVDLVDRYDPVTGFTGMERLTGWHCAIMMALQASGAVAPGAHRMELAAPAVEIMKAFERRGITHAIAWN